MTDKRPPKLVDLTAEQHHARQTPRLAITEPMAIRRHVGLTDDGRHIGLTDDGGPVGALVDGFTEVLRRLGYAAGARITPSPFGGWEVEVAVRPLSESGSTVKG